MKPPFLVKHQVTLPLKASEVFKWHTRDGALERLVPPWITAKLLQKDDGLEAGSRVTLQLSYGPFSTKWIAEHVECEVNSHFSDMQIKGPFHYWHHLHSIRYLTESSSILEEHIRFTLPGGALPNTLFRKYIKKKIKTFLRFRARRLFYDMQMIAKYKERPPLRIVLAGGSGFVGKALQNFLSAAGHTCIVLSRNPHEKGEVAWNPDCDELDETILEGCDVIINLAGASIGEKKWSPAYMETIRTSRLNATTLLVKKMALLNKKPALFLSASAVGFYGSSTDRPMNESESPGQGFLATVAADWEEAALKAPCRTVCARFGTVLSPDGGMLEKMLPLFRWGLGGKLARGKQKTSWIALDDLLYQLYHIIQTPSLKGGVNCTAPTCVSNEEFTKTLSGALSRPAFFPMPSALLKFFFGKKADELLLSSIDAPPGKLTATGFQWAYPTLKKAFDHFLHF